MSNIFATALSAVTMLMLGIVALQYRADALGSAGLTNSSAEAYNVTNAVSSNTTTFLGHALPLLFGVVVIVVVILMLVMTR